MFEEAQNGSSDMYSAETVPQVHEGHPSGSSPSNEAAAFKPAQQTACAQAGSKPTDSSINDSVGSQEGAPKASPGEIQLQFGSFGKKDEVDDQSTGEAILTGTEPSEDATKPADG